MWRHGTHSVLYTRLLPIPFQTQINSLRKNYAKLGILFILSRRFYFIPWGTGYIEIIGQSLSRILEIIRYVHKIKVIFFSSLQKKKWKKAMNAMTNRKAGKCLQQKTNVYRTVVATKVQSAGFQKVWWQKIIFFFERIYFPSSRSYFIERAKGFQIKGRIGFFEFDWSIDWFDWFIDFSYKFWYLILILMVIWPEQWKHVVWKIKEMMWNIATLQHKSFNKSPTYPEFFC